MPLKGPLKEFFNRFWVDERTSNHLSRWCSLETIVEAHLKVIGSQEIDDPIAIEVHLGVGHAAVGPKRDAT